MDIQTLGRMLLVFAGVLALVGLLMLVGGRFGLGSLPGDINIRTARGGCFFPLATSIVLSLILTIILNLVLRWFR